MASNIVMHTLLLQANIFQVVIATDGQQTFVFFIYGDIEWGEDANIGFDAGDGTRSFMLPGALTNQSVNVEDGSNVDVRGLYIYRVDLPSILDGENLKRSVVLEKFTDNVLVAYQLGACLCAVLIL